MTRPNSASVLRRTSEHLTAGAAAIAVTFLMLLTVEVRAAETTANPPRISVSYQDTAFATEEGTANVYRKLKTRRAQGVRTRRWQRADARSAHQGRRNVSMPRSPTPCSASTARC